MKKQKIYKIALIICFSILTFFATDYNFVKGTEPAAGSKGIELNAPLGGGKDAGVINTEKGGTGILSDYVGKIFVFGSALISVVAVIMLIIGGFEIMLKGSSGDITTGKERILQALVGLVLVFMSALILHTINPNFFTL